MANQLTIPLDGFAALADPTRRQVFERLAKNSLSVGDLAAGLPVSRPAVSQHLKVLKWDPPRRLVLAWQLDEGFKYDPKLVTEVEVTFTLLGPKLTRVDFEHRNLERFGEAAERLRGAMGTGWEQILESYRHTAVAE